MRPSLIRRTRPPQGDPSRLDPGTSRPPTAADTENTTTAMKKIDLGDFNEETATPPKPRMPAINATTKNVTTQLNMARTSVSTFRFEL